MILGGVVVPATPVLVPEVGRGRERDAVRTVAAYRRAARLVGGLDPDVLILILAGDAEQPTVWRPASGRLTRDFGRLDAPHLTHADAVDVELGEVLLQDGTRRRWRLCPDETVPEAALAALYFLAADAGMRVLPVSLPGGELGAASAVGADVGDAAAALGRRAVLAAVGELSARPARRAPGSRRSLVSPFDEHIVDRLAVGDTAALAQIEAVRRQEAGETLLAQLIAVTGALEGAVVAEILSYEAPFDAGFLVAFMRQRL